MGTIIVNALSNMLSTMGTAGSLTIETSNNVEIKEVNLLFIQKSNTILLNPHKYE